MCSQRHRHRVLVALGQSCNAYEFRRGFAKKSKGKAIAAKKGGVGGRKGQAVAEAEDKETTEFFLRLLQAPKVERK